MKSEPKKKILLVDDDSMTNTINRRVLEKTNLIESIECVNNGFEAIHFLENKIASGQPLPDFLFIDINMPFMNGFEFLKAIRSHDDIDHRKIRMIMLSSSFDPHDKEQAHSFGVNQYIEKPLSVQSAIEALRLPFR